MLRVNLKGMPKGHAVRREIERLIKLQQSGQLSRRIEVKGDEVLITLPQQRRA